MTHPDKFTGMIDREELNRMRWAARRGMLELDLVLEPFVTTRYAQLNEQDRQRFQQLMLCEDQDLFTWFMQRVKPDDEELAQIVSQVIQFAQSAPESR
ncbi:FAD assembly factor SdhE [Halioglobus japonicus]|nr:FAD assembly factor SdhE [Halioglobus japonicus]